MNAQKKQYNLLTAIRGILALWVLFYHIEYELGFYLSQGMINLVNVGYVAVDFFFVLSGFVIAFTYQSALRANFTKQAIGQFYLKRIARIYPLHLFILLLYVIYLLLFMVTDRAIPSAERFSIDGFFASLFLVSNWGGMDYLPWNVPAWSISAEMGAYLLFPLLCLFLGRIRSTASLLFLVAIICVSIGMLFSYSAAANIGDQIPTLGFIRCVGEFTLGIVVFQISTQHSRKRYMWISFLLASAVLCSSIIIDVKNYWTLPFCMFGFVLATIWFENTRQLNIPKVLIWLGEISYSVYLSHYLIRDVFKLVLENPKPPLWWFILYVLTVILCSHVLYHRVELPAQAWCRAKWLRKKNLMTQPS